MNGADGLGKPAAVAAYEKAFDATIAASGCPDLDAPYRFASAPIHRAPPAKPVARVVSVQDIVRPRRMRLLSHAATA